MERLDLLEADARRSLTGVPVARLCGKTVLVAGASGIVGTHLLYGLQHCQKDLGIKIQVFGLVRHGVPDHLKQLERLGHVRFLCGDLTDHAFLTSLPAANIIVHGATYGQPGLFMAEAIPTLKLNTTTTMALLEKLMPGGQFLFISTSEVYSGLSSPPFREDQIGVTNTTHPRSCYIEAKRCGEAICNAARNAGVDAKSARLCLAYGPGTRPGDKRVLNSFIERGLRHKLIELLDRGEANRTYCYIADAAYMLWRILLEGTDPVYNVGGISTTTIADLARLVGKLLDVPVRIPEGQKDGMSEAPFDTQLDLGKFQSQFGRLDFTDITTGAARTVEWQAQLYSA
jgi:nucleoside-diphosphate-sugar epimerase